MPYPKSAEGYMVHDHKSWSTFKKEEFPLKTFEDRDVDIAIDACGVCASDVHTISGGWGEAPLPLCVGHEIVGKVVKTGQGVKNLQVGDRVGVGAQISADLTCNNCKQDQENYCPNKVDTYGNTYPDGVKGHGGFSNYIRAHEYFTFKIPDQLETAQAAPMLCAGITVYSPLVRLGCGPGKKVAISGIGGLGHFALLFANALGAEVYAISHSPSKKDDALKLGAKHFICTKDKDWAKPYQFTFDFILNTANALHKFNMDDYFSTIKVGGKFHNVGFGNEPMPSWPCPIFAGGMWYIGASHIGNRPEMQAMLKLAADKGIKSWVQTIDISDTGCKEAVERLDKGDVRYRFTLVNFDKQFGKRA